MIAERERLRAQEARDAKAARDVGESTGEEAKPIQSAQQDKLDAERQRRLDALRSIKAPPNQTLGNARPGTRRLAKGPSKKLEEVSTKLRQDRRGLYAKYYAFNDNPFGVLMNPEEPMLEQRAPAVTRIDRQVQFPSKEAWSDLPFDLTNFMAVWEGFLVIDKPGDYWLFTGADFQSNVMLDGEMVLLNTMRDYTEVSTVLTLDAGLHPLKITYMEAKHGSPIDPLGSCNFMYVPEGASKPVPVPPSMLMLPEALWSNDAPIVTRLSKTSGEIGDEVTIYGQSLVGSPDDPEAGTQLSDLQEQTRVEFSGQPATILGGNSQSIRVRVPIGAKTGKVVVNVYGTPSNSFDFTVTTQFGLIATWHNLEGWSNYDFVEPGTREPEVVRLEKDFTFESRDELDLAFRNNPLAAHWDGELGFPGGVMAADQSSALRFRASGRLRVTLDGETKTTGAPGADGTAFVDFDLHGGEERRMALTIEWASQGAPPLLRITEVEHISYEFPDGPNGQKGALVYRDLRTWPSHLFFPPVVPPKPPEISAIKPVNASGEPQQLPFTVTNSGPSIREGQDFTFSLTVYGDVETRAKPVYVTVDGVPVEYVVAGKRNGNDGGEIRNCRGTLPSGLGEGEMRARHSVVTGEPVYIDVQNKGLIAYLYDLPNPGGYSKMPDLGPLHCFLVRKYPAINFENAHDFDLPFPAETFAVEWYGALIVETEGDYVFTGRSDDGILVWLDGNLVLADDNLHYQREKSSAPIRLAPGTYPFKMEFFENNVHEVCVLYWQCKQGNETVIPKQVIPKRNWTWDVHPPLPGKVSTGKRTDGSDPQ